MRRVLLIFLLLLIPTYISISVQAGPEFKLIYVVQEGDTLSEIANNYSVSQNDLREYNDIKGTDMIRLGQELLIPLKIEEKDSHEWEMTLFSDRKKSTFDAISFDLGQVYSIRVNPGQSLPEVNIPASKLIQYHVGVGDTLYDLARDFNTSINIIMALNKLESSVIRVRSTIKLPINNLTPRQVLQKTVKDSDIELLARAIYGEARGEPFIGQVAVGAVVINRVISSYFPNTFKRVIYQKNQFSAVADGQINLRPNTTAYRAAREALRGTDPTMGAMYYYNPKTAKHQWWFEKRRMMVTIGDHVFTK